MIIENQKDVTTAVLSELQRAPDARFKEIMSAFVRHDSEKAPAGDVKGPWYSLEHTFVMEVGRAKLPRPPITGKARGERPKIPHLA